MAAFLFTKAAAMPSLTATRSRNRAVYVLAFVVTILLGLASRRYHGAISELFGKYPGDALWAAMVFFGWGALRPRASTRSVALLALATCLVVEAMKLYQAPWIVGIRHTTLGHLIFGHVFSVENLAAYAVGVVVALSVEVLWPGGRRLDETLT
jgi:hypothetical protein